MSMRVAIFCLSVLVSSFTPAFGQTWPTRAVKIIVPYAPGGNTDSLARLAAERLTAALANPFVVENRAGAAGLIAAEQVARAAPDGYTLFMATVSQVSIAPLIAKINYDPIRDFAPISIVGTNPFIIAITSAIPAKTLPEFIAYAKAHPGELNYGSGGTGGLTHLSGALFVQRAGLKMTHVAYKGGAPALNDLLGGQVQMYSGSPSELLPHAKSDKIRLLAISSERRSPNLPNVPAIAELYPGHVALTWNGLVAPAKTPKAVIDRISAVIQAAAREPAFVEKLERMGVDPVLHTPAQFAQTIAHDLEMWRAVVSSTGLKPE